MLHTRQAFEAAIAAVNDKARECMRRHAECVEDLCLQTAARGPGWRLWVSQGRMVDNGDSVHIVYDTAFLPPEASDAPGSGTIYGPFS